MNAVKTLVLTTMIFTLVPTCAQAQEDVTFFGLKPRTIAQTACFGALGFAYSQNTKPVASGVKAGAMSGLRGLRKSATKNDIEWEDVEVDTTGTYLNNVCEITYEVDGEKKYDSFGSATADKLVDSLQKIRHAGGKVSNIEIKGHGAPECQQMGGETMLLATAAGSVLVILKNGDNVDITNLLKSVCKHDVHIQLNGCKTGRGEGNVAQNLSGALPGSTVAGGAFYQLSVPFTSNAFGTKNYYRHGQRVQKGWYNID